MVYFDLYTGEEDLLTDSIGAHHATWTQMEKSAVMIHEFLDNILGYQRYHRLREARSRDMAEYLNERVQDWSFGQTVVILAVSFIEVYVLRNFFADKKENVIPRIY